MSRPVRESLKQIDAVSWLIGDKFILSKTLDATKCARTWPADDGTFYSISIAPIVPPSAGPLWTDSQFRKIHDAGDCAAVWDMGAFFLKIHDTPFKLQDMPSRDSATKEHTTLTWLAEQNLSFAVPKLLFHAEDGTRDYLIITRVPGETIFKAWHGMGEEERRVYARRVAEIIEEMSKWESNSITGIDGKRMADSWMDIVPELSSDGFAPEALRRIFEALGMNCSSLFFCHCDLGPDNIVVDREKQCVGVIDWENAGYVPKAWPRTKAECSGGLDLDYTKEDYSDEAVLAAKQKEWRLMLAKALEEKRFPQVSEAYKQARAEKNRIYLSERPWLIGETQNAVKPPHSIDIKSQPQAIAPAKQS
ncbi:hypothetical protein ANO11243_015320 [Dothideomycetidae sp. 11243]|nr:hypothetical protein ANO11243_015320 [fungal sp. No.11243]